MCRVRIVTLFAFFLFFVFNESAIVQLVFKLHTAARYTRYGQSKSSFSAKSAGEIQSFIYLYVWTLHEFEVELLLFQLRRNSIIGTSQHQPRQQLKISQQFILFVCDSDWTSRAQNPKYFPMGNSERAVDFQHICYISTRKRYFNLINCMICLHCGRTDPWFRLPRTEERFQMCVCLCTVELKNSSDNQVESIKMQNVKMKTTKGALANAVQSMNEKRMETKMSR